MSVRNEGDVEIKEALSAQEERGPDLSRPQRSPEGRGRYFIRSINLDHVQ